MFFIFHRHQINFVYEIIFFRVTVARIITTRCERENAYAFTRHARDFKFTHILLSRPAAAPIPEYPPTQYENGGDSMTTERERNE